MKTFTEKVNFKIAVTLDDGFVKIHGDRWEEAFKESFREFTADIEQFINRHPFTVACSRSLK